MSILSFIYEMLIGPLELFFQMVFALAYDASHSVGLAIIPMSIAVNVLLLPFYNRADSIQAQERATQKRMDPYVKHIRKTFKGDERFLMLQAYYRENGYKPVHALKGTLPLLLEIPFFIAAYHFLSNLQLLNGQQYLFLENLGQPDALLSVGGVTINVLPIAMTLINIVSSEIYSHGATAKERLQQYGIAIIFLVLLYNSPSGLVLYWTLNNIFSLCKNMVNLTSDRLLTVSVVLSAVGVMAAVMGYIWNSAMGHGLVGFVCIAAALQIPILFRILRVNPSIANVAAGTNTIISEPAVTKADSVDSDGSMVEAVAGNSPSAGTTVNPAAFISTASKTNVSMRQFMLFREGHADVRSFMCGCVLLAVFIGVLIPSMVIISSPAEFVIASDYHTPLEYLLDSFAVAFGGFVIWFGLFYYLASSKTRVVLEIVVWALCVTAIVNFLFFGTNLGALNDQLHFDQGMSFTTMEYTINAETVFILSVVLTVIWVKWRAVPKFVCPVLLAVVCVMAGVNVYGIASALPDVERALHYVSEEQPSFAMSKEGKNVVVLMLDRAMGAYVPYLFGEDPDLERKFDGFTWYPNTISYGPHTNVGTPALFGGYEYTPEKMNERSSEPLVDKQNEALKVMPVIFDEAGYKVTVLDPPYAGYTWIPDLSIYDDYPSISKYLTETGQFNEYAGESAEERLALWRRNFLCYGIMKASPLAAQTILYQDGIYLDADKANRESFGVQFTEGLSKSSGIRADFMDSYGALCALPEMTRVTDAGENTFLMMSNQTTHNPMLLQEPEYAPSFEVDNTEYDVEHASRFTVDGRTMKVDSADAMIYYHANMAALKKVGDWLDFLRAQGVYDNTRIIIVADHGFYLPQFDNMVFGSEYWENALFYNPLLMAKDFGSTGFSQDDAFMTNADAPDIATGGLIEDPRNPFTGNLIASSEKSATEQHILYTKEWKTDVNNGNVFLPGIWYSVHDDMREAGNWQRIGEY